MDAQRAVVSSLSTSLDELVERLSALAEQEARIGVSADHDDRGGDGGLATDLFEVERHLRAAQRRLTAVVRSL